MVPKLLGISETVFEVTKKDQSTSTTDHDDVDANTGRLTFDESPVFVPVTALLLVQLIALAIAFLGLQPPPHGGHSSGVLEVFSSLWLVLCLWTILKGLFGKGKYGLPFSTILKSTGLAFLFVSLCR